MTPQGKVKDAKVVRCYNTHAVPDPREKELLCSSGHQSQQHMLLQASLHAIASRLIFFEMKYLGSILHNLRSGVEKNQYRMCYLRKDQSQAAFV